MAFMPSIFHDHYVVRMAIGAEVASLQYAVAPKKSIRQKCLDTLRLVVNH